MGARVHRPHRARAGSESLHGEPGCAWVEDLASSGRGGPSRMSAHRARARRSRSSAGSGGRSITVLPAERFSALTLRPGNRRRPDLFRTKRFARTRGWRRRGCDHVSLASYLRLIPTTTAAGTESCLVTPIAPPYGFSRRFTQTEFSTPDHGASRFPPRSDAPPSLSVAVDQNASGFRGSGQG